MTITWTIPEKWQEQSLRLSAWQAEPLSRAQALADMEGVRALLQQAYQKGTASSLLKIMDMVARYWLGHFSQVDFDNLLCTLGSEKYRALASLVYGQLLISQKRSGAHDMLKQGFDRIQPWLQAEEYFTLLKRHQQLSVLSLSLSASEALPLQALLNEAAVVRNIKGHSQPRPRNDDRSDTLG